MASRPDALRAQKTSPKKKAPLVQAALSFWCLSAQLLFRLSLFVCLWGGLGISLGVCLGIFLCVNVFGGLGFIGRGLWAMGCGLADEAADRDKDDDTEQAAKDTF